MSTLSLCLPFYKNPIMLAAQYAVWASYSDTMKDQIEIVLVDDGSPADVAALTVPRPDGLPTLRIYRVLVDIPWHQHGARNLAATEALGPWLFLTDMDHVLPVESLRQVLAIVETGTDAVYTFQRLDAPDLRPTQNERGNLKPHCNTFLMTKARFWKVGGYDEDCVGYGTDGYFRHRLYRKGPAIHLAHVPVIRYPREVIADASGSQPGMDPKAFRNAGRRKAETAQRLARKHAKGLGPTVLAFPWERVL